MFRFTEQQSSGSHSQCLAKITRLVQCWYRRRADVVSVMAAMACVLCTVQAYTLAQCTTHTPHRSYYVAIAPTTSARRLYQHWTNLV